MSEAHTPSAANKRNGSRTPVTLEIGSRPDQGASASDLEALLTALQAMQNGDFTVRLSGSRTGIIGKIADTFNDIVSTNQKMAQQLDHVGEVVGKQGKTRQRLRAARVAGGVRFPRRRGPSSPGRRARASSFG